MFVILYRPSIPFNLYGKELRDRAHNEVMDNNLVKILLLCTGSVLSKAIP